MYVILPDFKLCNVTGLPCNIVLHNVRCSYWQSQLPATGIVPSAAIPRRMTDEANQRLDEYIRGRVGDNWKFAIVSFHYCTVDIWDFCLN